MSREKYFTLRKTLKLGSMPVEFFHQKLPIDEQWISGNLNTETGELIVCLFVDKMPKELLKQLEK